MIPRKQGEIAFYAGSWPLGPDRPTLVFIHGAGQKGKFWQAQVDGLADMANTIAVDLPGHGNSNGGGFRQVGDYAAAIVDTIDALGIAAPVVCGLSMGGAIAQHLLIHHARRIKAGILINTGARLKVAPILIETIERNFDAHLSGLIDFAVAPVNQQTPDICRHVLASAIDSPTVAADDFRACDAFDETEGVSAIRQPVLVLSARQDLLTPVRYAEWLAEHIPGASHTAIDNAGHMSPVEQPDAVNGSIRRFLETL